MNEFDLLVALPIVFSEGDQASKPWEKDDLRDGNLILMLSIILNARTPIPEKKEIHRENLLALLSQLLSVFEYLLNIFE